MTKNVQSPTFVAMMCALNCVFLIVSEYFPLFSLLLTLGIPLLTCLASQKLSLRYILLFLTCTCLISMIDFQNAIFYIFPGIIIGAILGILIKNRFNSLYVTIIASLVSLMLYVGANYLIELIYGVNMKAVFATVLNLSNGTFEKISLMFFYIISLSQTLFTFIIIDGEKERLHLYINQDLLQVKWSMIYLGVSYLIILISYFLYYPLSLCMMIVSFVFAFAILLHFIFNNSNKKLNLIFLIILEVISLIIVMSSFNYLSKDLVAILPIIFTIPPLIVGLFDIIIQKVKHNNSFD